MIDFIKESFVAIHGRFLLTAIFFTVIAKVLDYIRKNMARKSPALEKGVRIYEFVLAIFGLIFLFIFFLLNWIDPPKI